MAIRKEGKHLGASSLSFLLKKRKNFLVLSFVSIALPFYRVFQGFWICYTEDLMSVCCQYMAELSISFVSTYKYMCAHLTWRMTQVLLRWNWSHFLFSRIVLRNPEKNKIKQNLYITYLNWAGVENHVHIVLICGMLLRNFNRWQFKDKFALKINDEK